MGDLPSLRRQLAGAAIVVAPGIYDGLSAALAERAGFATLYLSGASIAYTRFGRPDIGLVSMSEVAETLSVIRERVAAALIVDADTGFGNALNVQRTVALFERAGASAIQLEDQTSPKRCGHLSGKSLVGASEMLGKLKAALDARRSSETLIIARTDAIAVEGLDGALERAGRYAEIGADIVFVEAPRSREDLAKITKHIGKRAWLMANMIEGGATPILEAAELQALGYRLVIYPGGLVRSAARLMVDYFASLRRHGTTQPFRERMFEFAELQELLGTAEILERGKRYDGDNFPARPANKGAAE